MTSLKSFIRDVPDFPIKGVVFRDISPLLEDHFEETVTQMATLFSEEDWKEICTVVGIDARGFLFAAALALLQKKRLRLVRKSGKLPPPVIRIAYTLEYGQNLLEMQEGTGTVLVVDDVLATGGTLAAAGTLCQKAGYKVKGFAAVIDLKFLNNFCWNGLQTRSLVQYPHA